MRILIPCLLMLLAWEGVDAQETTRVDLIAGISPEAGAEAGDQFGSSVATTGEWAVVGAPGRDSRGFSGAGEAFVFGRDGSQWVLVARLRGSEIQAFRRFGTSVAIEAERIVIGAPGYMDSGGERVGAVYVFERTEGRWQQVALVRSPFSTAASFGDTVSLSPDHLLVGAPLASGTAGAALVLGRKGREWIVTDTLTSGVAQGSAFGSALAVDGDRAVIAGREPRTVHTYERGADGWREVDQIIIEESSTSVPVLALTRDRLVVGQRASSDRDARVLVFEREAAGWGLANTLTPQDDGDGYQDLNVAIDGNLLAVGVYRPGFNGRALWVYRRTPSGWGAQRISNIADYGITGYGLSVAGERVLLGAPRGTSASGTRYAGSADVYDLGADPFSVEESPLALPGVSRRDNRFGQTVGLDGTILAIGASGVATTYIFDAMPGEGAAEWEEVAAFGPSRPREADLRVALDGEWLIVGEPSESRARIYRHDGEAWRSEAGLGGIGAFGDAISVSRDRLIIGAPNDGNGSVSIYEQNGSTWRLTARVRGEGRETKFGASVAIDGERALVGSRERRSDGGFGSVVVLESSVGGAWERVGSLSPEGKGVFGFTVALDGERALAGVPSFNPSPILVEVVNVHDAASLSRTASLESVAAPGLFGSALALDGDRLLVGAPTAALQGAASGAAYLYDYRDGAWSEATLILQPDGEPGARFGSSVALDGSRLLIGAPLDSGASREAGAAFLFAATTVVSTDETGPLAEAGLSTPSPNPARDHATLWLNVPLEPTEVIVTLHDARGRTIQTLAEGALRSRTEIRIDTGGLASGVYAVRALWGSGVQTRLLTVVR